MTHFVKCVKLGIESEGLDHPPFPGEKGQYIFENISKLAWQEWLKMQTVLINEHRLASYDPKARQFLAEQREKFLFNHAHFAAPSSYIPK
ncbi:MAG: hypothetical protein RL637_689 [Pseudomonadota bacterium]|jgi:Fe-S cluster biosynthesis and repair protein YggX